jgi:hypothetical protein
MALDYIASTVVEQQQIDFNEEIAGSVVLSKKLQLKGKNFDVTIPAITDAGFGLTTLGIRPAAVPLYSFCPRYPGGRENRKCQCRLRQYRSIGAESP